MPRALCRQCQSEFSSDGKRSSLYCRPCRIRRRPGGLQEPPGHEARIQALEARIHPELKKLGLLPET